MPKWESGIQLGTRDGQPTPTTRETGTLYFVTDEDVLERWSGSAWAQVGINAFGPTWSDWTPALKMGGTAAKILGSSFCRFSYDDVVIWMGAHVWLFLRASSCSAPSVWRDFFRGCYGLY